MSSFVHKGWTVTADAASGLWETNDPKPIGVSVSQSFPSSQAAIDYIDKRETDKMFFKIKNGV